jgi:hypothetical protein
MTDLTSYSVDVSVRYNFSPMLTHTGAQDKLTQILRLAEDECDLLQHTEMIVRFSSSPEDISPARTFDPALGMKRNFAEAFLHLDRLDDIYQKQRLSSLGANLAEAANKSKSDVKVFGLSSPVT